MAVIIVDVNLVEESLGVGAYRHLVTSKSQQGSHCPIHQIRSRWELIIEVYALGIGGTILADPRFAQLIGDNV